MNYPLIREYVEAIKSAEDNFKELSYLRPVLDDDGQPIMTSGNFAVVFKMKDEVTEEFYALKCFTKEQEGRIESYKQITDELEYVSSNYMTSIRFLEKELFVDTDQSDEEEFPVLLMDWMEGKTLDVYIKDNINNQYALEMLAYQFNKMASWLLTQRFAHGDLKPENILVRDDGTLVLVDYDGMYVPAMKGHKARENGSPGFRHPQRTENDFDEQIDDFSIALIALSLKAIALNPTLFAKYGGNDRLLFSERDFLELSSSACFSAIQSLIYDNELATLFGVFMIAWAKKNLSSISYRLLIIEKSQKEDIQHAVSFYLKGTKFINSKDYEKAFRLFSRLAKKGKSEGENVDGLGNVCGNVLGANGLGYMYAYGYHVKQDYKEAVRWFKEAADNNFSVSLFNLGICYEKGLGVEKSQDEANVLYHKAAMNNYGPAIDLQSWEVNVGLSAEEEAALNFERCNEIISNFKL